MDPNLTTLNPITSNPTAHTHFHPPSGGNAVNFSPQFSNCDQKCANASSADYPSFKKPRTSQTPMKGVPCLQFRRGHCTYGGNCQFSHGIVDTQKLVPQWEEQMNNEIWNEDQRIISSMGLCWRFCKGEQCPFGSRCNFLHESPANFRRNLATSIGTNGYGVFSRNESEQQCKTLVQLQPSSMAIEVSQKLVYWKTRPCNKWEATGNCPFGVHCNFAHGHAELKKARYQTAMEFGNVHTKNMIPTAVMHASSTMKGNGTACEKKVWGKKCLLKWEGFWKISHIYADWIDDMPLMHTSLGKMGS